MFLYDVYIEVLFRPLLNALVFLVDVIPGHDIGLAIIVLTVIVKMALWPSSRQSIQSQRALQELQPELNRIRNKHKNDKQKQSQELMKFYKENKINPLSSCLPLLIQLPILLALYRVFREGLTDPSELDYLYNFVSHPGQLEVISFSFFDLSKPNLMLAIMAGAGQFYQSWMLTRKRKKEEAEQKKKNPNPEDKGSMQDMASNMTKQMVYVMPVMTVIIAISLPAGLSIYWITTTVFSIIQQWIVMKKEDNKDKDNSHTEPPVIEQPKKIESPN